MDRAKVHYFLPLVFFFRNDIPMPLKQQTHTHPPLLVNGYRVTIALTPFCASYLLVVFDSLFFCVAKFKVPSFGIVGEEKYSRISNLQVKDIFIVFWRFLFVRPSLEAFQSRILMCNTTWIASNVSNQHIHSLHGWYDDNKGNPSRSLRLLC